MNPDSDLAEDPSDLAAILASLSEEIRRPLEQLHQGVAWLLTNRPSDLTDAEVSHATTMLSLCDEIDQLTRVFLSDNISR